MQVTLGITGGIAAYKTPELIRQLKNNGFDVRVVATRNALRFVSKLSLETVSGNPVYTKQFSDSLVHIDLAKETDVFVVAPLSANTLSKMAHGFADNLLTTTLLATQRPILLCPAMNTNMWVHTIIQNNLELLKKIANYHILDPQTDTLACGDYGKGKMGPLNDIVAHVQKLTSSQDLRSKRILITSGATREHIDPVRFLSNGSSGKMGAALAFEAWKRGAEVTVISGHSSVSYPSGVKVICASSAKAMHSAVKKNISKMDVFISAAAVCDFMVKKIADKKIHKKTLQKKMVFEKTPDILKESVTWGKKKLIRVGFALESHDMQKNAQRKFQEKKLDILVANGMKTIDSDEIEASIIDQKDITPYPAMTKRVLAQNIWDKVLDILPR